MATEPDESGDEDTMRPEYDFRTMQGAVCGKYAARFRATPRVIRLADDISVAFPDEASVNAALRDYLRLKSTMPAGPTA